MTAGHSEKTGAHPGFITVVVADDHPIVRDGLRMMIERFVTMQLVAEAGDGQEALDAIVEHEPDIALLDIEMPSLTGLDVLREIRARKIRTRCIVLTLYDDRAVFQHAVQHGAMGFMLKDSAPKDILRGICRVASGEFHLGVPTSTSSRDAVDSRSGELLAVAALTPTERRVLHLIAENKSTRDIAEELFVSPRTVDSHRANICSKLGESGSHGLIRFAIENRRFL
jgi:DNA-binding NarL/FixJ family response regulator